jgi:hypothetical protein
LRAMSGFSIDRCATTTLWRGNSANFGVSRSPDAGKSGGKADPHSAAAPCGLRTLQKSVARMERSVIRERPTRSIRATSNAQISCSPDGAERNPGLLSGIGRLHPPCSHGCPCAHVHRASMGAAAAAPRGRDPPALDESRRLLDESLMRNSSSSKESE